MTDKRFFKVMAYAALNTLIMSLFVYNDPDEFFMYFMLSILVFDVLVSKDEEKEKTPNQ